MEPGDNQQAAGQRVRHAQWVHIHQHRSVEDGQRRSAVHNYRPRDDALYAQTFEPGVERAIRDGRPPHCRHSVHMGNVAILPGDTHLHIIRDFKKPSCAVAARQSHGGRGRRGWTHDRRERLRGRDRGPPLLDKNGRNARSDDGDVEVCVSGVHAPELHEPGQAHVRFNTQSQKGSRIGRLLIIINRIDRN